MGWCWGKDRFLPTLTCGIRERNWSVWREATAAANLKLRYVSLQVPTYFDYLLDKFAAVRPVVEETICWNDKEPVDILLCTSFPSKFATVWSSSMQVAVAYTPPRRLSDCPQGWVYHSETVKHFSLGGCTDDISVFWFCSKLKGEGKGDLALKFYLTSGSPLNSVLDPVKSAGTKASRPVDPGGNVTQVLPVPGYANTYSGHGLYPLKKGRSNKHWPKVVTDCVFTETKFVRRFPTPRELLLIIDTATSDIRHMSDTAQIQIFKLRQPPGKSCQAVAIALSHALPQSGKTIAKAAFHQRRDTGPCPGVSVVAPLSAGEGVQDETLRLAKEDGAPIDYALWNEALSKGWDGVPRKPGINHPLPDLYWKACDVFRVHLIRGYRRRVLRCFWRWTRGRMNKKIQRCYIPEVKSWVVCTHLQPRVVERMVYQSRSKTWEPIRHEVPNIRYSWASDGRALYSRRLTCLRRWHKTDFEAAREVSVVVSNLTWWEWNRSSRLFF